MEVYQKRKIYSGIVLVMKKNKSHLFLPLLVVGLLALVVLIRLFINAQNKLVRTDSDQASQASSKTVITQDTFNTTKTEDQLINNSNSLEIYTSNQDYQFNPPENWYLREFGEIDDRTVEFIALSPRKIAGELGPAQFEISVQLTDRPYEYSLELEDSFPSKPYTVNSIEGVIGRGTARGGITQLIEVKLPYKGGTLSIAGNKKYEKELMDVVNSFKFADQ